VSSLVLVECSLGPRVVSTKAVNEAGNRRAYIAESSSKSSESNSILYYTSSLSLVNLLEHSLSNESGGEESSN
jgi:hypothetical protein